LTRWPRRDARPTMPTTHQQPDGANDPTGSPTANRGPGPNGRTTPPIGSPAAQGQPHRTAGPIHTPRQLPRPGRLSAGSSVSRVARRQDKPRHPATSPKRWAIASATPKALMTPTIRRCTLAAEGAEPQPRQRPTTGMADANRQTRPSRPNRRRWKPQPPDPTTAARTTRSPQWPPYSPATNPPTRETRAPARPRSAT
jgi:hypothetical protein